MIQLEFKTSRVVELACAAARVNGEYNIANRNLILKALSSELNLGHILWYPDDVPLLSVTEEDLKNKETALKHMKRYVLLSLGGLRDFQNVMFELFSKDTLTKKEVSMMAYFPYFVNKELEEKVFVSTVKNDYGNDQHIDSAADIKIEVLKRIPLFDYGTNLYIAGTQGNLVTFSHKSTLAVGDQWIISGRIKWHQKERNTGINTTSLNYVKLRGEIHDT
jgi:hypothetical protein